MQELLRMEKNMVEVKTMPEIQYLSMENAGKELGVRRSAMYYYIKQMNIETKKFPLDRKTYISIVDLERIKAAKRAAEEGRH